MGNGKMLRTGTLTCRNMLTPFKVSFSATSCGVDTMTAPVCSEISKRS